ncbi:17835_t:CDS:2 [Racocetra persica]|uniref:17835_t:CDS:1 n=1 Tax=Racocetra persica TaxID=160502 RepID=A0ACA9KCF8_9GLOM|nr:17835_t:CDS:2 [Racocetra persica]
MNNNNQIVNNIPNTTDEPVITNSEAPNRKFFIQTLETHLAPDEVKKILADLDKNKDTFNHQTSGEVNQKLVELENKNQLTEQEIKEIGAKLQE